MPSSKPVKNQFPVALKIVRRRLSIPQEAFGLLSSRTYVSSIERGLKAPTLSKIDELAEVLEIHPLTLLALAYTPHQDLQAMDSLLDGVRKQAEAIFGRG